jgi:hypothetical protein
MEVLMKKYNIKIKFKEHWIEYKNHYVIHNLDEYKVYMQQLNNKF